MVSLNSVSSICYLRHWSINPHVCALTSSVLILIESSKSKLIAGYLSSDFPEQFETAELLRARIFSSISGDVSTTARLYRCHLNSLDTLINILMYLLHRTRSEFCYCELLISCSILSLIYASTNLTNNFWYYIVLLEMMKSLMAF